MVIVDLQERELLNELAFLCLSVRAIGVAHSMLWQLMLCWFWFATPNICFCRESTLNLIAAGALSWELTSAMDEDCDWHWSTSRFFCLFWACSSFLVQCIATCRNHAYVPNSQYTHSWTLQDLSRREPFAWYSPTSQWNQWHPWLDYKAHHTEACMVLQLSPLFSLQFICLGPKWASFSPHTFSWCSCKI